MRHLERLWKKKKMNESEIKKYLKELYSNYVIEHKEVLNDISRLGIEIYDKFLTMYNDICKNEDVRNTLKNTSIGEYKLENMWLDMCLDKFIRINKTFYLLANYVVGEIDE